MGYNLVLPDLTIQTQNPGCRVQSVKTAAVLKHPHFALRIACVFNPIGYPAE